MYRIESNIYSLAHVMRAYPVQEDVGIRCLDLFIYSNTHIAQLRKVLHMNASRFKGESLSF